MTQLNFPGRFTDEHIQKIEDRHKELLTEGKIGKSQVIAHNKSVPRKQEFLDEFGRTLSISAARKKVGISIGTWKRWKETDHLFCREYNALLETMYEDLLPSVLSRAKGYVKEDLDISSGYAEDAEGTIIRFNADTALATKLMDRLAPDDNLQAMAGVNVVIDVGSLLGRNRGELPALELVDQSEVEDGQTD